MTQEEIKSEIFDSAYRRYKQSTHKSQEPGGVILQDRSFIFEHLTRSSFIHMCQNVEEFRKAWLNI